MQDGKRPSPRGAGRSRFAVDHGRDDALRGAGRQPTPGKATRRAGALAPDSLPPPYNPNQVGHSPTSHATCSYGPQYQRLAYIDTVDTVCTSMRPSREAGARIRLTGCTRKLRRVPGVLALASVWAIVFATAVESRADVRDLATIDRHAPLPEYWKRGRPPHATYHRVCQAFDWTMAQRHPGEVWKLLTRRLPTIKRMGFTMIQLPPVFESPKWAPHGYPPLDLTNFNSQYGTEAELRTLVKTAREVHGLRVMGDLVFGVMALPNQATKEIEKASGWLAGQRRCWRGPKVDPLPYGLPPSAVDARTVPASVLKGLIAEGHSMRGGKSPLSDHFNGFVRFREDHPSVRDLRRQVIAKMVDMGFTDFRIDFAHGRNPACVKRDGEEIRGRQPDAVVASEFWCDGDKNNPGAQRTNVGPHGLRANTAVYDTGFKHGVNDAINKRRYTLLAHEPPGWEERGGRELPGLNGMNAISGWAMTSVENHDTGPSPVIKDAEGTVLAKGQEHWALRPDGVMEANALLLLSPGIPSVYWPHVFEWGDDAQHEIAALLQVRKHLDITAESPVKILGAVDSAPATRGPGDGYYAHRISGSQGDAVIKIGPSMKFKPPGKGWHLTRYGHNYAVWVDEAGKRALADLIENPEENGFRRVVDKSLLGDLRLLLDEPGPQGT